MTDAGVLEIVSGALVMAGKLAGPILIVAMVIGVVVALLQTITQIQEMSLTFVPKLAGAAAVILFGGHWMIQQLVAWVTNLWQRIPSLG
jgi:flagellar biosynthetic protein FliQ